MDSNFFKDKNMLIDCHVLSNISFKFCCIFHNLIMKKNSTLAFSQFTIALCIQIRIPERL